MKRIFLFFFLLIDSISFSQKQVNKPLSIGDKVPASIWKKIPNKATAKLIILDFWNTTCSNCIEAFTKMQDLQHIFPDELQIVLVNSWESEKQIKDKFQIINSIRIKNQDELISLPAIARVSGDTILNKLFPPSGLPHHVWLDKGGTVLYITNAYNATVTHIKKILNGEFVKMSEKKALIPDLEEGLFRAGLKSAYPAFYSGFSRYNSAFGGGDMNFKDSATGISRKIYLNSDALGLYKEAFGYHLKLLLEVKEKSNYQWPNWLKDGDIMDNWFERNLFSYEICVPFNEGKNINQYMQQDLNRFFRMEREIEGLVEKRKFNSLVFVKTKNDLLPTTKGGDQKYKNKDSLFIINNYPFSELINALTNKLEDIDAARPFIDETGIDANMKIDIQLTGNLKDVDNVRRQLQRYGLDIITAEREVEVLVIRDKSTSKLITKTYYYEKICLDFMFQVDWNSIVCPGSGELEFQCQKGWR